MNADAAQGLDDGGLFQLAQAGDHAAWASLCRRHVAALAAYLGARLRRPAVVDQVVGETLVAAWLHLGECSDGASFPGFLRRAGATAAMKWAKEHPDEALDEPFPAERLAEVVGSDVAGVSLLHEAMSHLGEQQRMALELHWRGGLSSDALAAVLRLPTPAAEALLAEAEAALAERLH